MSGVVSAAAATATDDLRVKFKCQACGLKSIPSEDCVTHAKVCSAVKKEAQTQTEMPPYAYVEDHNWTGWELMLDSFQWMYGRAAFSKVLPRGVYKATHANNRAKDMVRAWKYCGFSYERLETEFLADPRYPLVKDDPLVLEKQVKLRGFLVKRKSDKRSSIFYRCRTGFPKCCRTATRSSRGTASRTRTSSSCPPSGTSRTGSRTTSV